MYTYFPPFLLTLLQPSHSFLTLLRTFMPLTCCLVTMRLLDAPSKLSLSRACVREGCFLRSPNDDAVSEESWLRHW